MEKTMDLVRDKTKKDTYMCSSLLNQLKREEIRTDSPFQREANQWTPEAEYGLIVTAIRHEDIDSIKLCEQLRDSSVVVWLIDGKQRLTTLFKYRNNVFALGKGIEKPLIYYREARTNKDGNYVRDDNGDIIYDVIEYDLRGKFYKDLPEKLKEEFDNFPIDVVKHLDCTDEEIGYHIRRYNRQTSMNAAQSSITYMDNAAKYVKNIASRCEFFKRACYRESERKKGIIERLVAESIMTMFHMTDWKKGSKQLGAYINLKSSQKEFEILEDLLKRLDKIVDENTETLFTSKNSAVMIAAFYYFSTLELEDQKFNDFLTCFKNELSNHCFSEYNNDSFMTLDMNRSTKDKKVVMAKVQILKRLIDDYFSYDTQKKEEYNNLPEFISEVVDLECNEDDVAIYEESLNDYTVEVDNSSNLLDPPNHPSLVALTAYAFKENQDTHLSDWMIKYFKNHNTYVSDQKKNYLLMRDSFNDYLQQKTVLVNK